MLTEFFTRCKWKYIQASVRGPEHIRENIPNQDSAFIGFVGKFLLVMVCDGLGSHAHSDYGAKTLCKLFTPCFKEWSQIKPHDLTDFLRLLHCHWLMYSRKYGADKCGSTCQLAIINSKGKGWLAQLGDGMTLVKHNEKINVFADNKNGFGNETSAMGNYDISPLWRMNKIDLSSSKDRLLMMTDGISEDILPEAIENFVSTFDIFLKSSKKQAQKELTNELIHWPTQHHIDDKTIVVIERR